MNRDKIIEILNRLTEHEATEYIIGLYTDKILASQWISVEDELPEVNQSVDIILVDFNSFEGDQDGIDKVYGAYWDGEQWFYEPGIPIENKVLQWITIEVPEN